MFRLRNSNSAGAADTTITFGDARGYAVAGDFNGDGTDDVAVFRTGTWQIRLSTGVTSSVTFGSGVWPATVPVTGDWDGDGTDGIGTYTRATATWNLRNTATGPTDVDPFVFGIAGSSYPISGDWDGNRTDTVGIKTGTSWIVRSANSGAPSAPATCCSASGSRTTCRCPGARFPSETCRSPGQRGVEDGHAVNELGRVAEAGTEDLRVAHATEPRVLSQPEQRVGGAELPYSDAGRRSRWPRQDGCLTSCGCSGKSRPTRCTSGGATRLTGARPFGRSSRRVIS